MKIAVVIPCYKVSKHILPLISQIGSEVSSIVVVDDACPEDSAALVQKHSNDSRVKVIRHSENSGVGGAVCTGYRIALDLGADVIVKLDGDGQMDPALIMDFIQPIVNREADYTKGNRFYSPDSLASMPNLRLFGNSVLSFVNKLSSGYWNVMDPTNGYTAIHKTALLNLPLDKIDSRYFFESDMLFRLYTIRAVVAEVPMSAKYGQEQSSLNVKKVALEFPLKYLNRTFKRIFYNYFLRDFNPCSLQIVTAICFLGFGLSFGAFHWLKSIATNMPATTGTVMLAALPVILGMQFLLSAINYDLLNIPKEPLQNLLKSRTQEAKLRKVVNN